MTQEVEDFLTDPDADKADKLTLTQKLEAWYELNKEDSIYDESSDQHTQLRGATEEYLEHLKSSDIDEMSAAELEGVRSLMMYSSLSGDIASRLSGQLEYAEKKLAIDNYLADIEAKYPDRADEIPYMDAYLKRQLDNDYGRNPEVMGGLDGRRDVLDMVDMAAHEYNGVSVPLPEELQETVENMRTTSRRMLDQEYDETMDTVLADAMGEEAVSHVEIVKMVEYAQTFSRGEDGKYIGEVGEWINAVNETRANNGLEPLESIDYVDIRPVENTHNAEFTTENYMQMLENNEGNEGADAFREFLELRNSENNADNDSSTDNEEEPHPADLLHTDVAVARWIEQTRSSMTPEIAAAADEYMAEAKQNFAEMGARVENGDILEYSEELHNIWESDNNPNIHAALEQVEELFGDEGKAFMQTYNEYKKLNGEEAITPRQQEEQTQEQQPTAGYDAENFDDVEYAGYVRDGVAEEYGKPQGENQNSGGLRSRLSGLFEEEVDEDAKIDESFTVSFDDVTEAKNTDKPSVSEEADDKNKDDGEIIEEAESEPVIVPLTGENTDDDELMAAVDGTGTGTTATEDDEKDDSADTDTPTDDEELTDAAAVDPHNDYVVDGDPIPDLTTEDVKSENRLAVEAYLSTLDPTAEGFEDYKEVMLNFADDKEVSDVLKNMTGAQQFIQKRANRAGVPDLVLEQEDTLKNAGQQAIEKQGKVLLKAGKSDNIEDVKAFDDFMKAFGKDNGEETDPLVAATKSLREAVDEDRANTGKMSVKEAVFLANTSEEELKKRDDRVDSLFNSAEMQDLLANDADMKQFETFYDNVEIDSKDNITNEWCKLQDIPSDVSDWWSSKKSKETTAPATTTDGTSGAEGEAPEEEITDDEKKKHKLTGAEVRKDIYDLAVAKAMRDIMQDEALGQEDELSEEQKRALREKLKEKIAGYMMESTMSILTTQFAQNTYVDETGKKLDEKGQQAKRAEVAQNLFGQVVADPTATGKVHISETSVGATLGAQMSPVLDFKNKLEQKIGECKLVQRIKELDTRFEKKYGFWYKAAKNIAKTAIVNYTFGLPGLAVKTAIETGKAVKKFNDEYQQQKKAGDTQSIWSYMAHNKVKTLTVVASGIGAGVSAYLGVDAGLSGHFGAVGDWIKGGAETANAAAAQGASLIEKLTDYGKKAYDAAGNILSGNTHETTTLAGAKMLRASVALSAGFGAAVNSWSKGKWKEGWAAFGGSALGAMMTMVSNEIQAENMANMPTPENTGSGVNSGTEAGGATLKTNPNGLGADPNQFKLDTPKIDGMPETPEETIAKAQETVNHANNPDFERVKPGLNGGRVDIGAKAPKIELDPDVEKVINDPNAVPQVPEDYQGNGGKGGGQTTVQDDQQQEQQEQQEQQTVIDEEQDDVVEVPEERLAVELDEPKEVRVDDVPEEGSEKYKEMKIEAASNGAALEVTTPDGKSVEFVSAINEETGLRRSVMVTRDAEGNVVSEQEMSDKEARRLARQLAKTDARVNGDVSDTAEKAYKTIKHASSTELHHAKPVVELQQNEDGSQFSLSRGRNGLSGTFTQENGEQAKYSIIKSKLGGKTTVHYVVTEDNGHQRMMTDAERDKITKQIEETGDKKSIKKLHQFGKKLEYNTNEPQYTASENEIGFRRGNTNIKMTLDENGRAQYTAMQNGKLRPATPEEIKMLKEHAGDKMPKSGTSVQSEAAKASGLSDDAKLMNRVLASEATEKFATEKLGLDEKSLKIGVATDANGNVQASVAVSNNGALYQKGGNTTYAVLNEHKQIEAYTITNGQSQKMDLQSTAKFVGALPKDKIDAHSDFGKAINNTVATASRAQSMQRA